MNYQLVTQNLYGQESTVYVRQNDDGSNVSFADYHENEYQKYLAWLAEGNEPLPADEQ